MKSIHVVAAVIRKDGKILATQRGYGEFEGGWEFPGGKIESGETPEEALVREIKEELQAEIRVVSPLADTNYDYETFHLRMESFVCELVDDQIVLLEHSDALWLDGDSLRSVDWLPADIAVIEAIEQNQVV